MRPENATKVLSKRALQSGRVEERHFERANRKPHKPSRPDLRSLTGLGILVVGDRAGVLAKCAEWLREAGAEIEAVEDLAAADAFRVERRPNALVVDPVLSDGDGFFDLALPLVYAPIEERVAVLVVSDRFHDGNHHWVDDTAARALPVDHLSHPEVLVASVLGALRRARLDSRPRCGFTRASTPAAGSIARTRRTMRSAPPRDQEHASPWFLPPPPPLPSQSLLAFGPIHLDYRTREVIVAGRRARLQLRQYDLLLYLLECRGRAISEAEVLRNVWRSHHEKGASNVREQIRLLRAALGGAGILLRTVGAGRGWGLGRAPTRA